jgi:hypothetical protein
MLKTPMTFCFDLISISTFLEVFLWVLPRGSAALYPSGGPRGSREGRNTPYPSLEIDVMYHWRKLCQNQDLQKKLQIISSFQHNIAPMHFSLQFVNVHLTYISRHII